jgi:hypothetical protein
MIKKLKKRPRSNKRSVESEIDRIEVDDSATDLINALLSNRSVNTVQHATIREALFSVDPTDAPMDG